MTNKELIEKLQEFDGDRQIRLVIANVDPWDVRDYVDTNSNSFDATIPADEDGYIEVELRDNNILEIEGTW